MRIQLSLGSKPLDSEEGQTTSEYVAITAAAVTIAFSLVFVLLLSSLNSTFDTIGDRIESFAAGILS